MIEIALTVGGVVLPAFLVTWAVRRWVEPVPWEAAGGLLLLVLLTLGRPIFTSEMPVPLDEVIRGYPYRGLFGDLQSKNPLTNDTVKLFLPWMDVVRQELFAGRAPLWNRFSFSGYPLLGNGESAPFSPFFLLTLFVPLPKQIVAMAALKLFSSLLFTFLFLRTLRVSSGGAIFGAIVFTFAVYQNVYLYYSATAVSALLPLAAFAALKIFGEGKHSVPLFAIAVAALLAAGHPESVLHVAVGVGLLVLIEFAVTRKIRPLCFLAAASVLGLLVSAPAWVPVLEQVLQSERMSSIEAGGEMTAPMPPSTAWTLVNPDAFGNPARGTWSGPLNYSIIACSYFGLIALSLLPGSLVSRKADRRERLLVLAAVLLFLVATNWTVLGHLINKIPPFPMVANDKLRFVAIFLAASAAAFAVDRLRSRRWALLGIVAVAIVAAAAIVSRRLPGQAFAGFIALLAFGIFAAVARTEPLRRWIPAAAALATFLELLAFNAPFNALTDRRYFRPELPIVQAIRRDAPDEPFRILGHDWVFLQNASAHYRLEDIRGSDPMAWAPYDEFFRLVAAGERDFGVARVQDPARPGIAFLNVRYLLAEPGSAFGPPWKPIYRGRDGDLYRHERALPRFFAPSHLIRRNGLPLLEQLQQVSDFGEAVVVDGEEGNNPRVAMWQRQMSPRRFRITLETGRRTFVASSQPAPPGWKVRVNGEAVPIRRVNGAFIGFFVPPGKSRVVVEYEPVSFYGSVFLSLATVFAVLGWAGMRRRRRRLKSGSAVGGRREVGGEIRVG